MNNLPDGFIEMIKELFGEESEALLNALNQQPVTSIRFNNRKSGAEFPESQSVKWCESGVYLQERPTFTLDPLFHAGAYYVQEASSMIYETVISKLIDEFKKETNLNFHLKVLDLCAAPGGKTTAIINSLPDGSEIYANEYSSKRVGILKENLAKWGYPNTKVTNRDSSYYASLKNNFDILAVDAPCSGEGMMRKENVARTQWSPELIKQCSTLQKEILYNAVQALKPGGFFIYSTCTFNREENELNAEYINSVLGLSSYDLSFPEEWGISGGIDTKLHVYRFMPHKIKGEGLFLSVFRKPGEWIPSKFPNQSITNILKKDNNDPPEIEEILSVDYNNPKYPKVEVSKNDALKYLRRESICLPQGSPLGHVIITYKNLALGLAKNIGNRANNLYPKNWRIRIQ